MEKIFKNLSLIKLVQELPFRLFSTLNNDKSNGNGFITLSREDWAETLQIITLLFSSKAIIRMIFKSSCVDLCVNDFTRNRINSS